MATIKSLDERVDPIRVRSGSMIIPSGEGEGFEIVQPGEPMFSTASFIAVAYVEADGRLTRIELDPVDAPVFAEALICTKLHVNCPHCGEQQEGFTGDPRGEKYSCTNCKKEFYIERGCQIKIQ